MRILRLVSFLLLVRVVGFVAPLAAAEPVAEVFLTESVDSAPSIVAAGQGQVIVAWSVLFGPTAPAVLTSQRLDANLLNLEQRTIADDRGRPESLFFCPAATSVGADRIAFAWLESTHGEQRIAYRVTTKSGDSVSPIRYVEPVLRGREIDCPRIGGGANSFVIAWSSKRSGRVPKISFRARSFNASGAPLSEPLEMEPEGSAQALPPSLAVERRGDFTVAWQVLSAVGETPIRARMRRFLRTGRASSGVVEIGPITNASPILATFRSDGIEGVEVAWGVRSKIRVQRYDRRLRPLGESRDVATANSFTLPDLAVDALGRSVLVWNGVGPQVKALFLDDDLNPCEPVFDVSRDRPVSLAKVALPGDDSAVFTVVELADEALRLAVRKFSLAACPP